MIKFPVYFLHFWLPKAHVEAPTRASMVLAGLLLKFGTSGFFRIIYLINVFFLYFFVLLSFLGMVLSCFFCLLQSDLKSLAAFSSINHMSFLLVVIVLVTVLGGFRALLIMVSHGFISTLMFFLVGEFYHNSFTRSFFFFGGFFFCDMILVFCISLVFLFNSGVPLSFRFFGEFFSISVFFFF